MDIKQKLFEELKTKYSDLGFSREVLEGVATQLSTFVTEEKNITTAVAGAETMLKSLQSFADSRVGNYKKEAEELKKRLEELKKTQEPKPQEPKPNDEPTPKWISELQNTIKSMSEQIQVLQGDKVRGAREEQVNKLFEGLPEVFKRPYLKSNLASMQEEEFNKFLEETKTSVSELSRELKGKNLVFTQPLQGKGVEDSKTTEELEDAIVKSLV